MKRQILPLLFAFCATIAANAQCPVSGFSLTTQAEVNAFPTDFPGCSNLTVKMTIGSDDDSDITNLTPLNSLQTTTNGIEILNNPDLSSLNGLNNITTIGQKLTIFNNDALTSLSGLGSLSSSLGGNLEIEGNGSLTTLNGIGAITSIGGYLYIAFNPALTNITALNGITSVGDNVFISNNNSLAGINGLNSLSTIGTFFFLGSNPALTTVNGFNGLTSVGAEFSITQNASLTNLNGFTGLITVTGEFIIDLNSALTNIDEFDNLTTIGGVTIVSNSALSNCVSDGICAFVAPPLDQASISGNATGCATEAQVEVACEAAPVELAFFKAKLESEEVMLMWETASEQDNSFFEVEHSLNGKNFEMLGKVMGNGTTLTLSDYQFRDSKPSGGLNYYRLKQVDFDGKFQYSNIVSVLVRGGGDVEIFPNPTKGTVSLRGGGAVEGERTARVTDLAGRVVLEKNLSESSLIDLSGQPNGIYFIEIQTTNSKSVKRVIKE